MCINWCNFSNNDQIWNFFVLSLQEGDLRYLVENIWATQSALSAWTDLYDLVLVRWDKDEEWSPWNCILLTKDEAQAHFRIEDIEKVRICGVTLSGPQSKNTVWVCQITYKLFSFTLEDPWILPDGQCSSITVDSIYHIKHYVHTSFHHGSCLTCNWTFNESMFDISTYCVFTAVTGICSS